MRERERERGDERGEIEFNHFDLINLFLLFAVSK